MTANRLLKETINNFLQNSFLAEGLTSIQNTDELYEIIRDISYGIPNDTWTKRGLEDASRYEEESPLQYDVYYRDILAMIRFLLRYIFFAEHLTYEPIMKLNNIKNRVYIEIYTAQ